MNIVNRKESKPSSNTQPGTVKRLEEILPLMSTSIRKLSGVWEGAWEKEYSVPEGYYSKADYAFFLVKSCAKCDFEGYCKRFLKSKSKRSRIFEIQPRWVQLKQQARDRLLSPEGIEIRVNRSCQVEGAFGVIKQNMDYKRFRRRSMGRVTVEFALTCLGMNIRKYLRFAMSGVLPFY